MLRDRSVAVLLVLVLTAALVRGQTQTPRGRSSGPPAAGPVLAPEVLSSPSAADRFWEIGYEVAHAPNVTGLQADEAIILLTAVKGLNRDAPEVESLLLDLAIRHAERDYSAQVLLWLQNYVDESADHALVKRAVRYLLDRLNSWDARQRMLEEVVKRIGNKNAAVDSDLALLIGLLLIERNDVETAKSYLSQAYQRNKYNKVAFAKLAEISPADIGPGAYLEHMRLALRENPLDIDAALNLAQYAERLQLYSLAAGSYRYCAELFRYLYPSEPLPPHVYLPWAICSYNTERDQHVCIQIAESVRTRGRFDILLEAIAGRAAAKTGSPQEAQRIFKQAEQKAEYLLQAGPGQSAQGGVTSVRELTPKQFAWFFCFATPDAEKALDWANKAYSVEPNAPTAGALLAYALSLKGQLEWAKPLLESFNHNQIADLVQAQIQLADRDKDKAIATLNRAIAKDPGSLAAEKAKEMLREQGSAYAPSVAPRTLMDFLTTSLGQTAIPRFTPPDKMMEVQFSVRGGDFSYGSEIQGVVTLVNKGAEPLAISDDSVFKGNIRIDAEVTFAGAGTGSEPAQGVKQSIPNLVVRTVRKDLEVPPGRNLTTSLRLSTGRLKRVLMDYPQASLDIEFTLYIDPVVVEGAGVSNRLVDVKPATVSVTRPGIDLTGSYVRNRFNSISSGQEGQKIMTAQLFTGLLKEQYAMAEHGTLYPFRYAEWLPNLLRSALLTDSGLLLNQGQGEWVVKVNTMADMLTMPVDQELATVVAKNLNHPKWPVRLMAVYLLANSPGNDFQRVLEWVAEHDSHELVRSMAMVLGSGQRGAGPISAPVITSSPTPSL